MERKYYLRGVGIGIIVTAIIMGIALSGNKSMTDKEIIARAKELGMIEDTVLSDSVEEETDSEEKTAANTVSPEDQSKIDQILADADSAGMEQDKSNVQSNDAGTDHNVPDDTVTGSPEADNVITGSNAVGNAVTDSVGAGGNTADKTNTMNDSQGIDAESETGEDSDGKTPDKPGAAENNKDKAGVAEDNEEDEDDNEAIVSSAVKTITVVSGDGSYSVAKKLENAGIITSASNYDAYLCEHGYDKKLQTGTFSIPADASDEQIARIVTRTER